MKVWIVHDSKFGNGKSIAEAMGDVFREKMQVGVGTVKELSPSEAAKEKPDLIIVGTAIRMFSTSIPSKNWIRKLKRELRKENHVIPLGVVFITHQMKKINAEFWGKRFHNLLSRGIAITEVYPGWLSGRVVKAEGPLVEGVLEDFIHIAKQLMNKIIE